MVKVALVLDHLARLLARQRLQASMLLKPPPTWSSLDWGSIAEPAVAAIEHHALSACRECPISTVGPKPIIGEGDIGEDSVLPNVYGVVTTVHDVLLNREVPHCVGGGRADHQRSVEEVTCI